MFKKSLLAAALLVAGGTAASAAEIGVRNTWGTSTRDITHGRSWAVQGGYEQYTEESAGFALGIIADDFTADGLSLAPTELNAYRGSVFGPGGSITNREEVLDDDRTIFGEVVGDADLSGGDAAAAAAGAGSGDASSFGAARSGNANAAADAARGGNAGDLTQYGGTRTITGDNTVTQTAEAGETGWGEGLTVTGGLAGTPSSVSGRLAVSGSGYVRSAQGASGFLSGESFSFTGHSTQGFSELSTFSR